MQIIDGKYQLEPKDSDHPSRIKPFCASPTFNKLFLFLELIHWLLNSIDTNDGFNISNK